MPKIHELVKLAMDRYGVKGTELSKIAGISTNHISQFRNGKAWLTEDTLENMLEAMDHLSPGSKKYFCELLANQHISRMDNKQLLIDLIENANADEVEAALLAIGRKWKKEDSSRTTETNSSGKRVLTDAIAV
jgi:DNA-binding Xre family transcriptional regulator